MSTPHRYRDSCGTNRLLAVVLVTLILGLAGCTADLHEVAGPRVPVENLRGRIVREGIPVAGEKVKLDFAEIDSTLAEDRTKDDGTFAFGGVGAGEWTIRVSSTDPADFPSVTYTFAFSSGDSALTVPDLDLSLHGLEARKPEEGSAVSTPSFSSPIEFEWRRPDMAGTTVQVRVYGPDGAAVWYSEKFAAEEKVRWNGIANRGDAVGQPIPPGSYSWRLRVEPAAGTTEWTSASHEVTFTQAAP